MGKRKFPAVEATAAPEAALDNLASGITGAIKSDTDPYAMAGLLVEAIAAIAARVPPEQQPEIAQAVIDLLHERLSAHDVI